MTQAKHTPGPWLVETWGKLNGEQVTQVSAFSEDGNRSMQAIVNSGNSEANARLIAAAPELYELLKRYHNETPLGNQPHMIASDVDDLLLKIEGVK